MARHLFVFHDGALDELVSILAVTAFADTVFEGVITVDGDCLGYPTAQITKKLLALTSCPDVPVSLSESRLWNAFPWSYRWYSEAAGVLPIVNQYGANTANPEPDVFDWAARVQAIHAADPTDEIVFLNLGPMTPIAEGFAADPELAGMVSSIVWMGGALPEDGQPPVGNVDPGIAPGANANAEWNVYADPFALEAVWQSDVSFVMFPLNVTNSVILTSDVLKEHFMEPARTAPLVDLACQMYAMVAFEDGYSFWDTVTTAWLDDPELFTTSECRVCVDTSSDPAVQGTLAYSDDGYPITVAQTVDVDRFYDWLIRTLSSISVPDAIRR